jgi:hypothetical protein
MLALQTKSLPFSRFIRDQDGRLFSSLPVYNPAMKTLPICETISPDFKVEKTSNGQPYLAMNYEPPSIQSKIFDGKTFTFHLKPDIPFSEVYALEDMLSKYVEEVSVQD